MKVIETFLSIQGEGIDSGLLTYFVRFSGCNLRCTYCDTKYAYSGGIEMTIDEIINKIKKSKVKKVCVTGGEPLIQPEIEKLSNKLINDNYFINIETNGSIELPDWTKQKNISISMDLKCPSSGMDKKMNYGNIDKLDSKDSVKFIIGNDEDYKFAKKWSEKIRFANIIFNPVYGQMDLKKLAQDVIDDQLVNVRMGVQLHKIIWGPTKKGV
ncbi:MAG: radical SAM protein [Patescibacteria group bacterium]